jgi:FkbM family methyltransferase
LNSRIKKRLVNIHPFVRRLFFYYKDIKKSIFSSGIRRIEKFDLIILEYLDNHSHVSFIQIGANNGTQNTSIFNDILNSSSISILIEPVPYLFEQLKDIVGKKKNIFFENVAIGNSNEEKLFYSIRKEKNSNLPVWIYGLGSFDKNTILKHDSAIENLKSYICEIKVPVLTFDKLQSKYNLEQVNILQIDTEGYDYDIIKSINFNSLRPDILIFENKHLSRKDYKSCINILSKFYSSIFENPEGDTICF